jgi:hypothetical protein
MTGQQLGKWDIHLLSGNRHPSRWTPASLVGIGNANRFLVKGLILEKSLSFNYY